MAKRKTPRLTVDSLLSFLRDERTVTVSIWKIQGEFHVTLNQLEKVVMKAGMAGLIELADDPGVDWTGTPAGQILSLTPLAANRMGLRLNRRSSHWSTRPDEFRADKIDDDLYRACGGYDLYGVIFDESQNQPLLAVLASEEIARYDREDRRLRSGGQVDINRPRPSRIRNFIGAGASWPLGDPRNPTSQDCCAGIDLKYGQYCLWCNRSAEDHLIEPAKFDVDPESPQDLIPVRIR